MEENIQRKLIFLDIDGVLNCEEYYNYQVEIEKIPRKDLNNRFSPRALYYLSRLINETNSYIVLTSTWRLGGLKKYYIMAKNFSQINSPGDTILNRIIGMTPTLYNSIRGSEIGLFLSQCNYSISKYVIIDDDSDMGELKDHLVLVDRFKGFDRESYLKAKQLLL